MGKTEANVELRVIEANLERLALEQDNVKLRRELEKIRGGENNCNQLMKEVEQLHWQLNKVNRVWSSLLLSERYSLV